MGRSLLFNLAASDAELQVCVRAPASGNTMLTCSHIDTSSLTDVVAFPTPALLEV